MASKDTLKGELEKLQSNSFQCPLFQSRKFFLTTECGISNVHCKTVIHDLQLCEHHFFFNVETKKKEKLHCIMEGSDLFYQCMLSWGHCICLNLEEKIITFGTIL